jgi:hypothetical protein
MIAMCQSRFPDQVWSVSDMRTMSLNQCFDGILAWDSFFHLRPEDQRSMFPIFRKHAASTTVLIFTSGPSLGCAIGTYHGEPLYHGSLDESEYRLLLDENGFDVVGHVVDDPPAVAAPFGSRSCDRIAYACGLQTRQIHRSFIGGS